MFKWLKLIRWIKAHRKNGINNFRVVTSSDTLLICLYSRDLNKNNTENYTLIIKF